MPADFYLKAAFLAFDAVNLRIGEQVDVEMPADLDQLGGNDSHRAFVCGEGLVQLGHASADCRTFFEQVDEIS
jgi:hypothetical protein